MRRRDKEVDGWGDEEERRRGRGGGEERERRAHLVPRRRRREAGATSVCAHSLGEQEGGSQGLSDGWGAGGHRRHVAILSVVKYSKSHSSAGITLTARKNRPPEGRKGDAELLL